MNTNGLLASTPTAAGTSTFQVCAVDEGGRQACQTVSLTVKPKSEEVENITVTIESASCTRTGSYRLGDWKYAFYEVRASGTATGPPGSSFFALLKPIMDNLSQLSCTTWEFNNETERCVRGSGSPSSTSWSYVESGVDEDLIMDTNKETNYLLTRAKDLKMKV